MPAGKVVGRVFFARDQLLGMEKLTVRASANLIYDSRLLSYARCFVRMLRAGVPTTSNGNSDIVVDVRMLIAQIKSYLWLQQTCLQPTRLAINVSLIFLKQGDSSCLTTFLQPYQPCRQAMSTPK